MVAVNMPRVPIEVIVISLRVSAPVMAGLWIVMVLVVQAQLVTVGTVCTILTIIQCIPARPFTMAATPTTTPLELRQIAPLRMERFAVVMELVQSQQVFALATLDIVSY